MEYKRINPMSQRAGVWKRAYNLSRDYNHITKCYAKPSWAKFYSYNWCVSEMLRNKGWGQRIISHNTFHFTFAYQCEDENGNFLLRIITNSYLYEFVWNPF